MERRACGIAILIDLKAQIEFAKAPKKSIANSKLLCSACKLSKTCKKTKKKALLSLFLNSVLCDIQFAFNLDNADLSYCC
jgi:hypothetical protein